jgi:hypothetical protein
LRFNRGGGQSFFAVDNKCGEKIEDNKCRRGVGTEECRRGVEEVWGRCVAGHRERRGVPASRGAVWRAVTRAGMKTERVGSRAAVRAASRAVPKAGMWAEVSMKTANTTNRKKANQDNKKTRKKRRKEENKK